MSRPDLNPPDPDDTTVMKPSAPDDTTVMKPSIVDDTTAADTQRDEHPTVVDSREPDHSTVITTPLRKSAGTGDASRTSAAAPSAKEQVIQAALRSASAGFEDRGEVGRGGMCSVRRVFDPNLQREMATKALHPHLVGTQAERFIEEAQITAQLEHPNIAPVHSLGLDPTGRPCFAMRLVGGITFKDMIRDAGANRLAPDEQTQLLKVLIKVCEAVSYAHDCGVVHRDIKPANIMIGAFGRVYLMDWGIARLLSSRASSRPKDRPGSVIGTPSVMPPEQAHGRHDEVDARSDVFALGALLYMILYGRPPYVAKTRPEIEALARDAEPPPFEKRVGLRPVAPELIRIAAKAMAAERHARYLTVEAFQRDIEAFMQGVWHLPEQHFMPGATVVVEGEAGDTAYIIAKGRCAAYTMKNGQREVLREMGPGEVFGEMSVFDEKPRSASVDAIEESTLMVVSREMLSEGVSLNTWFGKFVTALADRFREADAKLRSRED